VHFFIRIALAYYSARRSRPSSAAASEGLVEIYNDRDRPRRLKIGADLGSRPVQPNGTNMNRSSLATNALSAARFNSTSIVAVATILAMV
jgi:hypothetical protein